jgi:beta-lactamase class A
MNFLQSVKNNRKDAIYITILAVMLAAFFFGHEFDEFKEEEDIKGAIAHKEKELRLPGYKFVNPLLECDIYQADVADNLRLNKTRLAIEDSIKRSGFADSAVYFRDLNNGPWLGINEKENFTPASLMKVPLMIAVLKNQEVEPGFLKKKVAYRSPVTLSQNIGERMSFVDGKEYTIEQYLEYAITYSSNEAAEYLLENVNGEILKKVFYDFGIPDPASGQTENYMSVQNYASFFRILYNASYLEKADSEKALSILSKSKFLDGLVAGIPKGVPVAHKFGERKYVDGSKEVKQLHDCGIIYSAKGNYLLCVMTRGDDFDKQKGLIKNISQVVYENFVLENE